MNVKNLIAKGQLKRVLEYLREKTRGTYQEELGISLLSQFNGLERERRIGIIDGRDYTMRRNRITNNALSLANELGFGSMDASPAFKQTPTQSPSLPDIEQPLQEIARENKFRRPHIAREARGILSELREWKDRKSESASFDPSGRKLKVIMQSFESLQSNLNEEKLDDLEKFVARIADLLEGGGIPEYEHLKEAYKLSAARGMKDRYIEDQLRAMPDDEETRITIAERIDNFTQEIAAK